MLTSGGSLCDTSMAVCLQPQQHADCFWFLAASQSSDTTPASISCSRVMDVHQLRGFSRATSSGKAVRPYADFWRSAFSAWRSSSKKINHSASSSACDEIWWRETYICQVGNRLIKISTEAFDRFVRPVRSLQLDIDAPKPGRKEVNWARIQHHKENLDNAPRS